MLFGEYKLIKEREREIDRLCYPLFELIAVYYTASSGGIAYNIHAECLSIDCAASWIAAKRHAYIERINEGCCAAAALFSSHFADTQARGGALI